MAKKRARILKFLQKQIHLPLPEPKSKTGKALSKNRSLVPAYFVQSWHELRKVTWPGRKESWQLVFAVVVFTMLFMIITVIADLAFSELLERVIL